MNEYRMEDIEIGMTETFIREITPEMETMFRSISGDENPLHWDDEFARNVYNERFDKHVVFGLLTASFYSTLAGMYLPGKFSLIHSFDELHFVNPAYVGDKLAIEGKVLDKDEDLGIIRVKATIKNQDKKLISRAKMKIMIIR